LVPAGFPDVDRCAAVDFGSGGLIRALGGAIENPTGRQSADIM
jgi:hypothetical protein